jgi:hypothetical protein
MGVTYTNGNLLPSSSSYAHVEVVEPALRLLHAEGFSGAEDEFLQAHKHLRSGDTKDAVVEAGKAFESTMKTICSRRGWTPRGGETIRPLIATLIQNGFIPDSLQPQLAHLRGLLESGVGVVRNQGAHGQGEELVEIPREVAEYALHLTAANIVFLVKLSKA